MNELSTVCIIDDDRIFIELTKILLRKECYCENFLIYNNGEQAILGLNKFVTKNKIPKLILLDINMPVMNGWEFLENFANVVGPEETSIFIISSSVDRLDIEKAEQHPRVSGFISKPIKPKSLLKISRLLDSLKK